MAKYIKRPVVIEAIQWGGNNYNQIVEFMKTNECRVRNSESEMTIEIETLEGTMKASIRDYIIKGVNGEFYPCKPDIFLKTYDIIYMDTDSIEAKVSGCRGGLHYE